MMLQAQDIDKEMDHFDVTAQHVREEHARINKQLSRLQFQSHLPAVEKQSTGQVKQTGQWNNAKRLACLPLLACNWFSSNSAVSDVWQRGRSATRQPARNFASLTQGVLECRLWHGH